MRIITPFKICIILSTSIHLAILYPWPFLKSMSRPEITFQEIELVYFMGGPIKDVLVKEVNPITSIEQENKNNIDTAKLEKLEIDLNKKSEVRIEQKEGEKAIEFEKTKKSQDKEKGSSEKTSLQEEKTYLDYCRRVREKIKSTLEKNRRRFSKDGEVQLHFVIDRSGSLKDLALDKTYGSDTHFFETIALESVREAAPFPPFGDEIKKRELLFSLPIRFTFHQ